MLPESADIVEPQSGMGDNAAEKSTSILKIGPRIWILIAVLILLLFLHNVRSTLIVSLSIPISLIATFALLYFSGFTLNTVTLGGLALGAAAAIGLPMLLGVATRMPGPLLLAGVVLGVLLGVGGSSFAVAMPLAGVAPQDVMATLAELTARGGPCPPPKPGPADS